MSETKRQFGLGALIGFVLAFATVVAPVAILHVTVLWNMNSDLRELITKGNARERMWQMNSAEHNEFRAVILDHEKRITKLEP